MKDLEQYIKAHNLVNVKALVESEDWDPTYIFNKGKRFGVSRSILSQAINSCTADSQDSRNVLWYLIDQDLNLKEETQGGSLVINQYSKSVSLVDLSVGDGRTGILERLLKAGAYPTMAVIKDAINDQDVDYPVLEKYVRSLNKDEHTTRHRWDGGFNFSMGVEDHKSLLERTVEIIQATPEKHLDQPLAFLWFLIESEVVDVAKEPKSLAQYICIGNDTPFLFEALMTDRGQQALAKIDQKTLIDICVSCEDPSPFFQNQNQAGLLSQALTLVKPSNIDIYAYLLRHAKDHPRMCATLLALSGCSVPAKDINIPVSGSDTWLHLAVRYLERKDPTGELVQKLLESGADPLTQNERNERPFDKACDNNSGSYEGVLKPFHEWVAQKLQNESSNLDLLGQLIDAYPYLIFLPECEKAWFQILADQIENKSLDGNFSQKVLRKYCPLLSSKNDSGRTLLHLAVEHGHHELLQVMIGMEDVDLFHNEPASNPADATGKEEEGTNDAPKKVEPQPQSVHVGASVNKTVGMAHRVLKHLGLFKTGKVTDSLLGRLSRWLWSWLGYRQYQQVNLAKAMLDPKKADGLLSDAAKEAKKAPSSKQENKDSFKAVFGSVAA